MTTERRALLTALALLALLALGCANAHEHRRGDRVDVSSYPPDIQAAYKVFAVRCSRCHTLARPLNARISDPQHWIRYVARMRRQPGSGINHGNADVILKFLLYYHRAPTDAQEPPAPEPPAPAPATPHEPEFAPPPPAPGSETRSDSESESGPGSDSEAGSGSGSRLGSEPQGPPPPALPPPGGVENTGASDAPQGGNP